jgi:tetratricopeptide (TPR) repeat protein
MDTGSNLWIWLGAITLVGGFGLVTLLRAYLGNGDKPTFTQAVAVTSPPETLSPPDPADREIALKALQKGNDAFNSGRYRWAADQYAQALQAMPNWAEAYHNRGLAVANLGQTGDAAQDLAKAAGLYLDANNTAGADLVRAQLQQLKA